MKKIESKRNRRRKINSFFFYANKIIKCLFLINVMKDKEKLKKEYLNKIKPQDVALSKIPETIGNAFTDGLDVADQMYRDAIKLSCKEVGIDHNIFFRLILKNL